MPPSSTGSMGQRPSGRLPPSPHEWVHQSQLLVENRQTRFDQSDSGEERHPHIAATMIRNLEVGTSPNFQLVRDCKDMVVARCATSSGGGRVGAQPTQVWVATTGVKIDGKEIRRWRGAESCSTKEGSHLP